MRGDGNHSAIAMTAAIGNEQADYNLDTVFTGLADRDRRCLLEILYGRSPEPVTRQELAENLASLDPPDQEQSVQESLLLLQHVHLPKLEAAGLIEHDTDRGTVTFTDHPVFQDSDIMDILTGEVDTDPESVDALFRSLADFRRRTILDILSHQFHPIHVETLAREIGAVEHYTSESEVPIDEVERITVSLRHCHLPVLSDAGLIDYDREDQMVAHDGHPLLSVPWMHSVLKPDFRPSLTGESELQDVATIEGREEVISFGQYLGEHTEEELFCMFTHRDMLEAGCFSRIQEISRRGVTVYLGTFDPVVREYIQENAPEIVLWEPKMDWLNLPVDGNRVGRLVFSDREAVMLGTLKETEDGGHWEKALVGKGMDNPLVVMIRQMLDANLEQDDQKEDLGAQLPF